MDTSSQDSFFAPAERSDADAIRLSNEALAADPVLRVLLDSVPNILIVLDDNRQIVFANNALVSFLGIGEVCRVLGLRPGEAFNCIHAFETPGGCGTSETCQTCGAVKAVLTAIHGAADVMECHIMRRQQGDALDLRVSTTPVTLAGRRYTLFAVTDISNDNRRRALERIFFHDVLNTAGGVWGAAELMAVVPPDELLTMRDTVTRLSKRLIDEIQAQRQISAAESGELEPEGTEIAAADLVNEVAELYRSHKVGADRFVDVEIPDADTALRIVSDKALLGRTLGNLVKNALEASLPGEVVTIGYRAVPEGVEFRVNNPAVMPRDIQLQLFQRSFSTKGKGRGLGTYSIKLLGERYLGGKVRFESSEAAGTTFFVTLPPVISAPKPE